MSTSPTNATLHTITIDTGLESEPEPGPRLRTAPRHAPAIPADRRSRCARFFASLWRHIS